VDSSTILALVGMLFTGGVGATIGTVLRGRSEARQIDVQTAVARERMPAEVDSIAIQNAEQTLAMQMRVNEGLVAENARLVEEIARTDEEIAVLHAAIASRDQTIGQIRADLTEANQFGHEMLRKLADANERYAELVRGYGEPPSPELV
jgi:septal ring factor EnvC (AmiA/AmiB activator)